VVRRHRPLTSAYTVITPDLRGFGLPEPGTGSYSHAGDVAAVLADLGIRHATIVGASFGALVALQLAHAAPTLWTPSCWPRHRCPAGRGRRP